ncbi:FIG00732921: hypothetical protein [Klebsiella pneumoniae IS43]|uniref:C2H2-type domain-containing protein n=1 Tax=Klebsiella pneumoniae IS43 TaxID=1432552 RepID=W1DLH6_KLEPN|nr:FIG00732921: hypothetical protein [Klebsiella pneumoniae IS43]
MLIAFNHRAVGASFQPGEGFGEQGGFAGAGAGNQIQHQLLFCCEACAVACRQAVVFIQHVDLHFQHPPLALPRGVGTRFAVAVMQVALWRAGGGEVVDFDTGDGHRLAWGGREGGAAERGMRVSFVSFNIEVAFATAACCTHNLLQF